jgi:hypothetical protein
MMRVVSAPPEIRVRRLHLKVFRPMWTHVSVTSVGPSTSTRVVRWPYPRLGQEAARARLVASGYQMMIGGLDLRYKHAVSCASHIMVHACTSS